MTSVPSAPISSAEDEVRKRLKWGDDIGVQFVLVNETTDEKVPVTRDTPIFAVIREDWMLTAVPASSHSQSTSSLMSIEPPPYVPSVAMGVPPAQAQEGNTQTPLKDDGNDDGDRQPNAIVTFGGGTIHMSAASVALVEYKFMISHTDEIFSLKFRPGQTVQDAKKLIQARYSIEDITDVVLLFAGKDLRDAFVLDRLRIGTKCVLVHIRDRQAVLLLTARA
jgi:hypothetical protein